MLRLSEIHGLFGPKLTGAAFVVTMDACLSPSTGSPGARGFVADKDGIASANQAVLQIARAVKGRRMRVIFGCSPDKEARKYPETGGLFSAALAKALSVGTGDDWADGNLTDVELFNRVQVEMKSLPLSRSPGSLTLRSLVSRISRRWF